MINQPTSHLFPKILFGVALAVVAALIGYLAVYWWVFRDFQEVLNVSSLKNQIVATQDANDVKNQLKDLGYDFQDADFYQLNKPTSTHYRANVLEGYEPKKVENTEVQEEGYYFYDQNGMAYYFTVDENNQIDPETFVPLILE